MSARRSASWLLLLLVLALTACGDDEEPSATPSPQPISVFLNPIDADLAERVRAAADRLAAETAVQVVFPQAPPLVTTPAVDVSSEVRSSRAETPVRYWAALAPFWSELDAFDLAALPEGATFYLPEEYRPGLKQILGTSISGRDVRWIPAAEVAAAAAADPTGLAFLPFELADPRLRSLEVNGVDLLRGGDAARSRLVERLWLTWDSPAAEGFGRALALRLTVPAPPVVRLVATGDIIPARCVYARHRALDDYTSAFRDTADFLRAADITAGSLDAALSDAGAPFACEQTFNLLAPARSVEGLAFAGFDVVTVATNHAKDCGAPGGCGDRSFLDTLANLRAAGIEPVGGGEDLAQAHKPVVLERRGLRFAFLAYDDVASSYLGAGEGRPGTAALSAESLTADIAAARRLADVVIVLCQWGSEYTPTASQRQRDLARLAIDAGATLVVGNHPHVAQGIEWRGDGFIAYALGNFVFDQDWSVETQQGFVLEAAFVGSRLASVRLLPIRIVDMHRPTWASENEARSILQRVSAASAALSP